MLKLKCISELSSLQKEKSRFNSNLTKLETKNQEEYYRWEMKTKVLLATKKIEKKRIKHDLSFLSRVNEECNLKKTNRLDAWAKILLGKYKKLAVFGEFEAAILTSYLSKQNKKKDRSIIWLSNRIEKLRDNPLIRKIIKKKSNIRQKHQVNIEWLPLSFPTFSPDFLFIILPYRKNFEQHLNFVKI